MAIPANACAEYGGPDVSIGNGASQRLPLDRQFSGVTDLLDLSNPLAPAVKVASLWTVDVQVVGRGLGNEGYFEVVLVMDADPGDNVRARVQSPGAPSAGANAYATASRRYLIPAGRTFTVEVFNHDGAESRPFAIESLTISR